MEEDIYNGCPKCYEEMSNDRCNDCGGSGVWEEDDGVNDWGEESCDTCNGTGFHDWCRGCGWDDTFGKFLQPKYQKEWEAKQITAPAEGE